MFLSIEMNLHLYMTVKCPPMKAHPCKKWIDSQFIQHTLPDDVAYIDCNWLYVNMEQHYNVYNICDFVGDETLPFIDVDGHECNIRPHDLDMCNRLVKGHYHRKSTI